MKVSIPVSERSPKGSSPNENVLLKLLYLKITELYKKRNGSKVRNWAIVRNQLAINDKIKALIEKYEHLIFELFLSVSLSSTSKADKNINYLTY